MWDRAKSHDRREALFGGRGAVRVWGLGPAPMSPFTALLACELEPGGSVGEHVQTECPETVIVLEGRGRATISGQVQALAPGTAVFLPLGETLALDNSSPAEPLRYLIIKAKSS